MGGVLFGVGMTLGSGCGYKTLIRIGGGSLQSLVVLRVSRHRGVHDAARAVRRVPRRLLEPVASTDALGPPGQDLPSLLAAATGVAKATWIGVLAASSAARWRLLLTLKDRRFRSNFDYTLGGVVTGLVVVGGWYVSGKLGYRRKPARRWKRPSSPPTRGRMESFSFVSPWPTRSSS